jgi:hypothetical protein
VPAQVPARLALALLEQGRLDLLGRSLGGSAARLSSAGTSTSYPVQSSAERYDRSSRSWSAESATLPAGQVYGAATLLRDGTALTVGGRDGTLAITAALEQYTY